VGNAILVDQRRFVDDKVRWLTAGFDCRRGPEVRNEYNSDQRGRQCRTTHRCLPSTNVMRCSDFRCGRMRKKVATSAAGHFEARGLVPSIRLHFNRLGAQGPQGRYSSSTDLYRYSAITGGYVASRREQTRFKKPDLPDPLEIVRAEAWSIENSIRPGFASLGRTIA